MLPCNLLELTIMDASTGPLITHQMAALSFISQHLREIRPRSIFTRLSSQITAVDIELLTTHPMSSKCSLNTAQMVTQTVGVPTNHTK